MLTNEDIKNLTEYQKDIFTTKEDFGQLSLEIVNIKETMATKDDFGKLSLEVVNIKEIMATKEDLKLLEGKFDGLLTSIDNYAKKADSYFQELVALSNKVNRHERWFHLIADKLNIKLDY